MKYMVCLMVFVLASCDKDDASEKFAQVNKDCMEQFDRSEYGNCLEQKLNANYPKWLEEDDAYLVKSYISWSKAAGVVYKNNGLTDAEFDMKRIEIFNQLVLQAKNDQQQKKADLTQLLYGLSLINNGQYQTHTPQTTTYNFASGRPITCTTIGNVVNCF